MVSNGKVFTLKLKEFLKSNVDSVISITSFLYFVLLMSDRFLSSITVAFSIFIIAIAVAFLTKSKNIKAILKTTGYYSLSSIGYIFSSFVAYQLRGEITKSFDYPVKIIFPTIFDGILNMLLYGAALFVYLMIFYYPFLRLFYSSVNTMLKEDQRISVSSSALIDTSYALVFMLIYLVSGVEPGV